MSNRAWIVWVAVLAPMPAFAQPAVPAAASGSRVEIQVTGLWSPSTSGGTAQSIYSPPLVNGTGTGSASQTLNVDASTAWGVDAVLRVYATRALGLEAGVGRTWSVLTGSGNSYRTALEYVSLQPPDYRPQVFRVSDESAWPDTRGDWRATTLVLGPVWRHEDSAHRTAVHLSGGLSLQRFGGTVRSLAYTEYHLGGHSTLFGSQHRVEVEPTPEWFVGPYVTADVGTRLNGRVGVVAGARLHAGHGLLDGRVRASRLVNPDEDMFVPGMDTVRTALESGATITQSAVRWQAFVGLSILLK